MAEISIKAKLQELASELTAKEIKVVEAFEEARPGTGIYALQNIQNPDSGWAEIIAEMDESEIVVTSGENPNNGFMYRHIH